MRGSNHTPSTFVPLSAIKTMKTSQQGTNAKVAAAKIANPILDLLESEASGIWLKLGKFKPIYNYTLLLSFCQIWAKNELIATIALL